MSFLARRAGAQLLSAPSRGCCQRRLFSPLAVHARVFPATLHHYRRAPGRPGLYDSRRPGEMDFHDDGVEVAADGLVYPKAVRDGSNGATMLPNTFSMQEFTRNHYDEFLDRQDAGHAGEMPQIYTIPKATPIPDHLILVHEHLAWFSLQPSRGMSLKELNRALDDFFDRVARKESVGSWLSSHPFEEASDNAEAAWKDV